MKKLMLAIGLGLIAGSAYAACIGGTALCYDDTTVSVNGLVVDGTGTGVQNQTSATINAQAPKAKGQLVFCSDCNSFNGAKGYVCASTGTGVGAYVGITSATAVTACK